MSILTALAVTPILLHNKYKAFSTSAELTDCVNTGDITGARGAEGTVAAKGMFSSTNTVTNCTNSGVVTVG